MGINPWDRNLMWAMRACPCGKEKGDPLEIPLVDDFSEVYSRQCQYSSLFGLHWFAWLSRSLFGSVYMCYSFLFV